MKHGILQQVAGEGEDQPTVVSNITFISTLDDMAQKDFRNQVELVTSKGKQTFKNCRFGQALREIRQ